MNRKSPNKFGVRHLARDGASNGAETSAPAVAGIGVRGSGGRDYIAAAEGHHGCHRGGNAASLPVRSHDIGARSGLGVAYQVAAKTKVSVMPQDYVAENEIRTACANAGVLTTAVEDFIVDFQNYKFTRDEAGAYIDRMRVEKPHRFALQSDHDIELATRAFVAGNLTAQGQLYRSAGLARYNELKTLYANGIPESVKKQQKPGSDNDHARNPWNPALYTDPKTGRYTARALTLQGQCVKAMGVERASQIASVFGAKIGDTRPPKAA